MWKTWKTVVWGLVAVVAGIALPTALLEWPLSAPLPASAAASVLGGYYEDCYVDGTANCPDDETCADLQLDKELSCTYVEPNWYCPYEVDVKIDRATYKTRENYEYASLSDEDPGYVGNKNLTSIYCHDVAQCSSYCLYDPDYGQEVCLKGDDINPDEASRVPTEPDNTTAECNQ